MQKTLFILLEDIIEIIKKDLDETLEIEIQSSSHFITQDLCRITFKREDKTHQLKIENVNQNIMVTTECYYDSVDVESLQGFLEGYTACLYHFFN